MAFDNQGNFNRVHNWTDDFNNEIEIMCDRHDAEDDNFAEGLSQCLLKNGRAPMQGELNLGNFKIKNVARGTASSDAVNKSQLDSQNTNLQNQINTLIPKGAIFPYGGITAPDGWLICDGSEISRTTYADLFAVIGTAYGEGNGTTTFNLPDGRERSLWGNIRGAVDSGLPNITGSFQSDNSYQPTGSFYLSGQSSAGNQGGGTDEVVSFDASRSSSVYGATEYVRPQAMGVYYIIKY